MNTLFGKKMWMAALMGSAISMGTLGAQAGEMGACNYTMKNMFAGPYKVCDSNLDEAACSGRADENENSDAAFTDGTCTQEGAVGVCTTPDHATTYYEGDADNLAIGCGFQNGTWSSAGE